MPIHLNAFASTFDLSILLSNVLKYIIHSWFERRIKQIITVFTALGLQPFKIISPILSQASVTGGWARVPNQRTTLKQVNLAYWVTSTDKESVVWAAEVPYTYSENTEILQCMYNVCDTPRRVAAILKNNQDHFYVSDEE